MSNGVLITPETARDMNARAAIARKAKAAQTKARLKLLDDLLRAAAIPREPPAAIPPVSNPEPTAEASITVLSVQKMDSPARAKAVSRIETQLEGIDKLIDAALAEEKDTPDRPNRLDRLSSARNRLFEHWCCLTGQPKPGNRKPAPERAPRAAPLFASGPIGVVTPITEPEPPSEPTP